MRKQENTLNFIFLHSYIVSLFSVNIQKTMNTPEAEKLIPHNWDFFITFFFLILCHSNVVESSHSC